MRKDYPSFTDKVSCLLLVMVLSCQLLLAQQTGERKMITGTVMDENSQPLPGVTVLYNESRNDSGTSNGTTTDANGKFSLTVPDPSGTLVFSFIGLITKEVMIPQSGEVTVVLEQDTRTLEEVVVVGYGTQKKINLTGAVDQVGSEVLENRPLTNLTRGLQGVIPNLNIRLFRELFIKRKNHQTQAGDRWVHLALLRIRNGKTNAGGYY